MKYQILILDSLLLQDRKREEEREKERDDNGSPFPIDGVESCFTMGVWSLRIISCVLRLGERKDKTA